MKKTAFLFSFLFLCLHLMAVPASRAAAPVKFPVPNRPPLPLKPLFPTWQGWNQLKEGENLQFGIKASGGRGGRLTYSILRGKVEGMEMDSLGRFSWTPAYDLVDRQTKTKSVPVLFEVRSSRGERATRLVDFKVEHVNQAPVVDELKPWYVGYNLNNVYQVEAASVRDEDGDPIIFIPIPGAMPEGSKLSPKGEFTWKPSLTQFNKLRNKPLVVAFYVEDQPGKARTEGQFKVEVTQQDLPPSIQMIPSQKRFQYKEDVTINLKFQVYDPNGEGDINAFNFIADRPNVPAAALIKNNASLYEFTWKPGYEFVEDPLDSLTVNLTFYAIDKSNKQEERRVTITLLNAVNEAERDQKFFNDYRASLLRAWDLMEQLKDTENDLKKKYNRARRGKKGRSVANASLGATTGIAPVVIDDPARSKKISIVGGTTVMTIGTLEATEVFGRSTKDLVERLNYIIEKRNELQTKGDIFARKYALRSARRRPEFLKELDDFVALLNLKGLVALELDAAWQNKHKATDENMMKTFKDYQPEK